jgi:hypothetical protein
MSHKHFVSFPWIAIVVLSLCLCQVSGWCATVTVGSTGAYATLNAAVDDFGTWGDGNGDTIELISAETHTVADRITLGLNLTGDNTFTIESDNPAANAVILHATNNVAAFRFGNTQGTYNLNRLSIIPAMGSDFSGLERSTIALDDGLVAPDVYTLNINGCIFSANDGSNQPNLNFNSAAAAPRPGVHIFHGDGSNPSGVNLNVSDSIFAHAYFAGMRFARNTDSMGMNGNAGPINAVFDNVLWQRQGEDPIRIRNHNPGDSYTWQNCAIVGGQNGDGIHVAKGDENPTDGQGVFTIDNCLISHTGGTQVHFRQNFEGTVVINDSTIFHPNNNVGVRFTALEPLSGGGVRSLTITDTIINVGDQMIRTEALFTGVEFSSVNINNVASGGTLPYSNDGTIDIDSIVNALNALYGGMGPLADDPMFLSVDTGTVTSADSTMNDFLDVQASSYGTADSGGSPLEGGAEYVGTGGGPTPTPTQPPLAVEHWELY